jgi:hypothetical protein
MCGWSLNATFCPFLGLCATADQLLQRFEEPLHANRHPDHHRFGDGVGVRPESRQERTTTQPCNSRAARQFGGSLVRERTAAFVRGSKRGHASLPSESIRQLAGTILGTIRTETRLP